jgi:hypothetical protein
MTKKETWEIIKQKKILFCRQQLEGAQQQCLVTVSKCLVSSVQFYHIQLKTQFMYITARRFFITLIIKQRKGRRPLESMGEHLLALQKEIRVGEREEKGPNIYNDTKP